MNRREFLGTLTAGATLAATMPKALAAARKVRPEGFLWADLLHFGMNMWGDFDGSTFEAPENAFGKAKEAAAKKKDDPADGSGKSGPQNHLRFDYETWKELTAHMAEKGLNAVVIDMGEAVKLPRHPELAVSDSWETDRFVKELDRLRGLGLEPIPKFNFSTTHDAWLKDCGHQVSTPKYYEVCADIVKDAYEIFGKPRLIHIGYEEEFGDKRARTDEMWWHDLHFLVDKVEALGARAWTWTDYPAWRPRERFIEQMPKSVLQSAWWYPEMVDLITCPDPRMFIKAGLFADLEKMGYDQVPCGGNYCTDKNMAEIVKLGDAVVKDGRLKGYLTTTWKATVAKHRKALFSAVDQMAELI